MNLTEYQAAVTRTRATSDRQDTLKLALAGLCDELGEIAGPLKKSLWQGHALDRTHLQDEIGDVLWYLATLCNALGLSLETALEGNVAKLRKRYPDGFSCECSLHRSTEPEPEQQGASLRLKLWEVTNDALGLSLDTRFTSQDMTQLGVQLGRLIRVLARRHIHAIDETHVPTQEE
jgi:NTP pyrophosphatase (non-canonical NTP hydrolase)